MLKQDYLLRQIESLAMSLSKLFFNKDMVVYEIPEENAQSETDILYNKLRNHFLMHMLLLTLTLIQVIFLKVCLF